MSKSLLKLQSKIFTHKHCTNCRLLLHFSKFRKIKPLKTGPFKGSIRGWRDSEGGRNYSNCYECEAKSFRKRYKISPIPQMLSNSKIRAKKKGILHNINGAYLKEIWPKDNKCPVLGTEFEMGFKDGKTKKFAPSLDRIDPEKGYVKDNLIIVSDIVNRVKTDASLEIMKKILDFYIKKLMK